MGTAFADLQRDWLSVCRGPEARAALEAWSSDPVLAGARCLDDILKRCGVQAAYVRPHHAAPDPTGYDPDHVLAALACRAPTDHIAARTLLQTMVCGLVRLSRTAAVGIDNAPADLISLAWERIVTYPYEQRPTKIAANILLDVRKRYWRHLTATAARDEPAGLHCQNARGRERERVVVPGADEHVGEADEVRRLLGRAVQDRLVTPGTAELIWSTRAAGEEDQVAADRLNRSVRTMRARRRRAEARLAPLLLAS